ncbi:MAG: hypothetical protein KGO81_11265 [Bacteroidota bacterium]|nr:hypothetical protein [Bacteroidota bacterium]
MHLSIQITGVVYLIASASLFLFLIFFYLLFIQFSKRKIQHFKEVKELQTTFEQTLLQTQIEIQEQTFNNISEEIHDNIGQILSLVRLKLNTLGPSPTEENINDADEWLQKAIHDLRHLSHSLNTSLIRERGLCNALIIELEQFQKTKKFTTEFECDTDLSQLEDSRSIILFRMIQEMLNNIVKHAKASLIKISVQESRDTFIFTIYDNGIGFNTQLVKEKKNGAGLTNLFARAKTINAAIDLHSEEGKGTTITINVNKTASFQQI